MGGFITFESILLWRYYSDKKPTGYWRYYHSRCRPLAAMGPDVHAMRDELILQISCHIFLAFKWIWMMRSGQNISHYTTAKLSVHCEIMTWSDDKTKLIHKNISTRLRLRALNLSKTKIPVTIVKAQMPSNLNQKSRPAGRLSPSSCEMCVV